MRKESGNNFLKLFISGDIAANKNSVTILTFINHFQRTYALDLLAQGEKRAATDSPILRSFHFSISRSILFSPEGKATRSTHLFSSEMRITTGAQRAKCNLY